MMRKVILLILIFLWTSYLNAQALCDSIVEAMPAVAEACADAESVCVATLDDEGDISSETMNLADMLASEDFEAIETIANEDELSFVLIVLPLQDEALLLLVFGNTRLENTVALNEVEVLALRGVNLRELPSVTAGVVGSLLQGHSYNAVGRLEDNTWLRVQLETGQVGWVSAQFLSSDMGFAELEAVSPNSRAYVPMQAFDLSTEDICSGVLLIAPDSENPYELAINELVIQVNGAALVQVGDEMLHVANLAGEVRVQAFGFEQAVEENERVSTPLNDSGMLVGIPSEGEAYEGLVLDYVLFVPETED